jgi:hypothetical protein
MMLLFLLEPQPLTYSFTLLRVWERVEDANKTYIVLDS